MRTTPLVATLVAALLLVAAAPAAADSIAYVKDGNVWLTTPDGSRQFQVTDSGGYSDVSQADNGTMIALHGVRLHRLDRQGNVLADFDTPVSDTRPAPERVFYGPFEPAISPDGTKVAYTYYYMTQSQTPTCFPPQCVTTINEGGTGYSWADRQTGWDEPGLGKHSGWRNAVWVDGDTTMLSDPTHMPNADVILDTLSDGTQGNLVHNWFSDMVQGNPHVSGGDISRDRRKLAFATGENDSTLSVYSVPSFPTTFRDSEASPDTYPAVCYRYGNAPGGRFSQPTFSPDGSGLAWAAGDGLHVAHVPSFDGGCTLDGATANPPLVVAGASEPDWGPADVPAARTRPGSTSGPGAPSQAGKLAVAVKAQALSATLRSGLRLTVSVPGKGKLVALALKGRTPVAGYPLHAVRAGRQTITLRFSAAGRRALARGAAATLTVRVGFLPAGGSPQLVTLKATIRR